MDDLNLGVIGNSAISALIDGRGRVVWCCLPRFDSDPVFCSLLNGGPIEAGSHQQDIGYFEIELDNFSHAEQRYLRNTAILVTTLFDDNGQAVEITDFAPRFKQLGRVFRPMSIVRSLRPIAGTPRITIKLRPAHSYGAGLPDWTRGSNHVRYIMPDLIVRCTTNAPITYLLEEVPFVLEKPLDILLGPDESLNAAIDETARQFFDLTQDYWREWCRYLSLPLEWQSEIIRAAITLKLSNYEESGGIVAAMTTSIPESSDSGRNWDYRYCWLRDATFVVKALNRLGATRTMEDHIYYITNIIAAADGGLQPVYGITLDPNLTESEIPTLSGYRGMGPVRCGNQAHQHIQNDVYGSAILAATQAFFDERLANPGGETLFHLLEHLGERAFEVFNTPDAGLWEFRTKAKVHTFSAVMCWAACDRLANISNRLDREDRSRHWRERADQIRSVILERAFNTELNSFTDAFDGDTMDASLLLMQELGFIDAADGRFLGTLDAVGRTLKEGDYLYRYTAADDFGRPETSFTICTFWYIDALAAVGRRDEARALFENLLSCRNSLGLLSEDIDPVTGELWGNFPQTYSMVGLINSAMRLSRSWDSVL